MTTINTMQDLIQLLRDQPEWAEELRGILLSPELRDLPAAVRELAHALAASTAQTNERLTNIEADIGVLKEDVGTLKGDVSTIQVQVNGLNGSDYERRAEAKALARSIEDLDFNNPRVVKGPVTGVQAILSSTYARARNTASQEGRTLPTLSGQENFLNCDIIIADMGDPDTRDRRTPPAAYALFEASITADANDVQRAKARAETLAAIMQAPVTPAVIADNAPEQVLQQAADAGVELFLVPDR